MTLRNSLLAAILKSLLRGKTLLGALFAYWITPVSIEGNSQGTGTSPLHKSTNEFLKEAEALILGSVSADGLQDLSRGLRKQFLERLQTNMECMLPSYSHQLPTGSESGRYLTLDVGGSTLRVALVELHGRNVQGGEECMIVGIRNFHITPEIKGLVGMGFFDWMAARIAETLSSSPDNGHSLLTPLPMALAWSFPIEQTSLGGGKLRTMGKGFMAQEGLIGQDLGQIVKLACKNHGLDVELRAIVNDSSACLLSRSYSYASTRFGLILGTGFNLAAYLPVSAIGRPKFGERPLGWFDEASHVIVNTELGMFGHDILPLTRWDRQLLGGHSRPNFQPLEHLVSGMYLGEICRLVLVEAIESTGIFGGIVPSSLRSPYSLKTETLSQIESDSSSGLVEACKAFAIQHPSPCMPTYSDMSFFKSIASFVSVRSSALVATCVYALWDLRLHSQKAHIETLSPKSPLMSEAKADLDMEHTTVAFNGSVIEHYTGYLSNCQRYLDELVDSQSEKRRKVKLVSAKESSLLGAAVALACVESVGV